MAAAAAAAVAVVATVDDVLAVALVGADVPVLYYLRCIEI